MTPPGAGGDAALNAMEILGALEAVGAGGLIAPAAMIIWRILAQRASRVRERHAAGDLLGTELTVIAEAIRGADWQRSTASASYEQRAVPRDVYSGLAASARLADFDPQTREFLYRFYWRASLGDHAYMNGAIREAIERVALFTAENAPGAGAALGRLKRYLVWRRRRRQDRRGGGGSSGSLAAGARARKGSGSRGKARSARRSAAAAAAARDEARPCDRVWPLAAACLP